MLPSIEEVFASLALLFFFFASIFFCFPFSSKSCSLVLRSSSLSLCASSLSLSNDFLLPFAIPYAQLGPTYALEDLLAGGLIGCHKVYLQSCCPLHIYALFMYYLLRKVFQYCPGRLLLADPQLQLKLNFAWPPDASLGSTPHVCNYKIYRSRMSEYLTVERMKQEK